MKKSKFLLLGSVASMAAIPFVAAKCGGTKDEEKKPAEMPGGGQKDPKTPAEGSQNPGTEGGGNQQGSEINVKVLKDKINSIWGLAPEFKDRLQNSFKEGDTYQSVLDKIASKLSDKEKQLVKLASDDDKNKKLGLQAQQKIKIKVGAEELELEFGKVSQCKRSENDLKTTTKQALNKVITKTELGKIAKKDSDTVKAALLAAVKGLKLDELTIDLDQRENKAKVKANAKSTIYEGEVTVTFTGTEGGSDQQGSEINVKVLKDKINSIWGLAPEFKDRLQNSFKEGDTYQSVLDKIASKLSDKEKQLVKLASDDDKNKKLGLQAQQKIKIKVGAEELELEFGKVSKNANAQKMI
ncbi:variable surface lipoprotein [Mycoplasmopsis agalactiae]|uniref:variable surface lipoprotein n=1 Tax=Mycoplasmopsis agalactiae TaxID=2110 RepID=UPI00280B339A|nr:variable surface lipoprotein [Mycoplasmopsis agalactiae]